MELVIYFGIALVMWIGFAYLFFIGDEFDVNKSSDYSAVMLMSFAGGASWPLTLLGYLVYKIVKYLVELKENK